MDELDELFTAKEFQGLLKVSLPYVYKIAERGQIPCVRIQASSGNGKRKKPIIRFRKKDIEEFIRKYYNGPST